MSTRSTSRCKPRRTCTVSRRASLYPREMPSRLPPRGLCRTALAGTKQVWYGPACDWPVSQPVLAISIHVVTPRCLRNLSPHDWLPPPLVPALSFSLPHFNLLHPTPTHHLPHSNHQISIDFRAKMLASSRSIGAVARMGIKQPYRLMSTAQGQGTFSTQWASCQLHRSRSALFTRSSQL
jgi:hypothetical protein